VENAAILDDHLSARAQKIATVLLDVDGVLTRGDIVYAESNADGAAEGLELKMFSVRDGSAIRWALREGLKIGLITGRVSRVVERRAKDLGVSFLWQGVVDKAAGFERVLSETKEAPGRIAYMGDDILDLPILTQAGLAACPADAHEEVKSRCHFVSRFPGGGGAVRELLEEIFKAQGRWERILGRYLRADPEATKGN
jgi:3-deoxy-D-manno-octulosonate 8-phosphate phosphatase (KDO 8-P phosphatase)